MLHIATLQKSTRLGVCAAACAALLLPCLALAALGESEASVQADATRFQASVKLSERGVYRMHEIQLASGNVVREYVGVDGRVFAVAWRGPFAPDLRQTLGKYFQNYQTAAAFNVLDHHHLQIRQSDLVVEASGHMRAFRGQAYLPQAMPAGFQHGGLTLMRALCRALAVLSALTAGVILASCGGSDTLSPAVVQPSSNVLSVVVDQGPSSNSVNTLFTTVTVCVPGTATCQTIDHIQVDTGSFGLRILSPVLTLALPLVTATGGGTLVECVPFVDGYSWGPVATADIQVTGESASSVPVQLIGDSRYTNIPSDCSSSGASVEEDTVATFGANGILGIGVFAQDCGLGCVAPAVAGGSGYPYYTCSAQVCTAVNATLAQQVPNPVSVFPVDNNGSFIQLPAVAAGGAATVTGSVIFGIDTETNNASGSETVLNVDGYAEFTVVFNGQTFTDGFIDSGSNGMYFNDSAIATCTTAAINEFYCPPSTLNLNAMLTGTNGVSGNVSFSVGNAQTILSDTSNFTALPLLAGTIPSDSQGFDFGLAFFYGRRVAAALEGKATSAGSGPYVAY